MRRSMTSLAACSLFCGAAFAAEETTVQPTAYASPRLSVVQPVNPVASKPGAPLITAITVRLGPQVGTLPVEAIIPGFHFVAPGGNAVLLHRELISDSANNINFNANVPINIPADAQKAGAVITGSWTCNIGEYYVTLKTYIMDSDGNRSNEVQYTVHCNGG